MDHREERVTVETDRYRITGTLTLPREGYRSRVSDFLNAADMDFIALRDAEVVPLKGTAAPQHHDFIALGRRHVILVAPAGATG